MICLEMFGSGLRTGTRKIITRAGHQVIRKALSMVSTEFLEGGLLWISQKDFVSPAETGIYQELDLKILGFVAQKMIIQQQKTKVILVVLNYEIIKIIRKGERPVFHNRCIA